MLPPAFVRYNFTNSEIKKPAEEALKRAPRPKHAFISDKSINPASHWTRSESGMEALYPSPSSGEGLVRSFLRANDGRVATSGKISESKGSSHVRAEGLSMLAMYRSRHEALMGWLRIEPQEGQRDRACVHIEQLRKSCNGLLLRGSSHATAERPKIPS